MRNWLPFLVLFLAAAWSAPALAVGDCEAPGYVAAFDHEGLPNNRCHELMQTAIHWEGGNSKLRLLAVVGEPQFASPDELRGPFEDLAGRVGRAMTAMGRLRVDDVSILITTLPDPDHASDSPTAAFATTFTKHGECFITYYWPMDGESPDFFVYLLAHEIFHCITLATVYHATSGERVDTSLWWMEGTAEYFAQLAYPGTHYADRYVAEFDRRSPSQPLWRFDYASVVYFFWLAQQDRPSAVSQFMRDISSGSGSLQADLQRAVSAEQWKRFGEAYLDREIRQPGARALVSTPRAGRTVRIDGATNLRVPAQPFVLHRERVRFVRGKVYALEQRQIDPGVSVGFSLASRDWQSPPDSVSACDQDVVFRVLATTIETAGEARYDIRPREGMETATACCLVGEWVPTAETLEGEAAMLHAVGGPPLAAEGISLSCAPPAGGWTLRFGADGRGEAAWKDFAMQCTAAHPTGATVTSWTRGGSLLFEWQSRQEGAAHVRYTDNTVAMHLNHMAGPMTLMDRTFPDPGPSVPEHGIAIQCARNDLRVEGLDGFNSLSETYTRAVPITPP